MRKPLRCEAGWPACSISRYPSRKGLGSFVLARWRSFVLTLEGADKVAPEPGLLGEGGVVGVEVEVHLAHSGVAAAHPETQKYAMETQTSSSSLGFGYVLLLSQKNIRSEQKIRR